jgi:hypothetical protein
MTANIEITVTEKKNVTVIPWGALNEDPDGKLYVLTGDNNVNNKKEVTAGINDGDKVEIISGLNPGDTVLIKKQKYKSGGNIEEAKGFLQMRPQKRKTNSEILTGTSSAQGK